MTTSDWSIASLHKSLAAGRTSGVELVAGIFSRADAPSAAGVFLARYDDEAMSIAAAQDAERKAGASMPPLAGIPVSVKDNFDIAGEVTRAGSRVLADMPEATTDAEVVHRLCAAGAILVGRTNMSEFAYTPFGLNPHFGSPLNPWDETRIPGGSSSGAAVSVARRLAVVAIGTDTGGSVRVPAALCGLVGFKPSQARVSRQGILPLSPTLDSVGWMGTCLDDCVRVDAILSGRPYSATAQWPKRLAVPREGLEGLDEPVAAAFDAALDRLSNGGVSVEVIDFPELVQIAALTRTGGFSAYEAARWQGARLESAAALFDPMVLERLELGRSLSDADYRKLFDIRSRMIAETDARTAAYDGLILPTCRVIAPAVAAVRAPDQARLLAGALLAHTAPFNFLDRGALTLPITEPGKGPVGLMLVARRNDDDRLLALGRTIESICASLTRPPELV